VWLSTHGITVGLHKPCGCGIHWRNTSLDLSLTCHGEMPPRQLMPAKNTASSVCKKANALAKQLEATRDAVRIHMRAAEEAEVRALPIQFNPPWKPFPLSS
jgi:hypothetical protein